MNKRYIYNRLSLLIVLTACSVWCVGTVRLTSAQPAISQSVVSQPDRTDGRAPQFFRSNSLGMALEEVSRFRIDDYEFVLKRVSSESGVTEFLLQNGTETQRAEYEWKGAVQYGRFYERDRLLRETVETDGRLQEERLFSFSGSDEPIERRVYEWNNGELQRVSVFGSDASNDDVTAVATDSAEGVQSRGTEQSAGVHERYIRGNAGELLQVLRSEAAENAPTAESDADASARVAGIYSSSGAGKTQWHFTAGGTSYFYYTEDSTQISERYMQGKLVYRKEALENAETTRIEEWYAQEEKRISSVYSAEGNILSSRSVTPNSVIESEYFYQNGELAELRQMINGTERRVLYSPGDGEQPDEKIFENSVLQREVQYHGSNRRSVILYRNGEAVARVEYDGEEAVKRESLIGEDR